MDWVAPNIGLVRFCLGGWEWGLNLVCKILYFCMRN